MKKQKRLEVATIWRYSETEFYFANHLLDMIFTDHGALLNGDPTCHINFRIIRPGLPRNELETVPKADNIGVAVSQPAYDTRQGLVLTAANVQFRFLEERDPEWAWLEEPLGLFSWDLGRTG